MKTIPFSYNCTFIQYNRNDYQMIVYSGTDNPVLDLNNRWRAPFIETTIIVSFASRLKYDNIEPYPDS